MAFMVQAFRLPVATRRTAVAGGRAWRWVSVGQQNRFPALPRCHGSIAADPGRAVQRLASDVFASHSHIQQPPPEAIMVLRSVGPVLIALLMRGERPEPSGSDWLLHGPTDPEVVDAAGTPPPELTLLAAE